MDISSGLSPDGWIEALWSIQLVVLGDCEPLSSLRSVLSIIAIVRTSKHKKYSSSSEALEALNVRYAKGEVSKEEAKRSRRIWSVSVRTRMLGGVRGWGREAPAYSMFAQHGHYLGGESPLWVQYRQRRRKPLAEDKCKLARACMKEVGGKIPSQRTETGYKAGQSDESAK